MLADIVQVRNKLQPKGGTNTDVLQFDYKFWKELASLADREKEKALTQLKSASTSPETAGVVLAGKRFRTTLKIANPTQRFSKEEFIDLLLIAFPELKQQKPKIRECATAAVIPAEQRKTYTVEEIID